MIDSRMFLFILYISTAIVLLTFYNISVLVFDIFKRKRKFKGNGISGLCSFIMSLGLMAGIGYCLFNIPKIFFYGVSWNMIEKVGPGYIINSIVCLSVVISILYLYLILSTYFIKENGKPIFKIMVLSILSAIGNSIVIFIVNQALDRALSGNRRAAVDSQLYLFFLLGVVVFTITAVIVRKTLISITSEVVYEKRLEIINKILKSPYFKFINLEEGSAYSALNNDTEVIGNFVNSFVSGFTGIITLVTCFIYMGTMNLYGTLFSICVVALAAVLFLLVSKSAEMYFEKNRDIQNVFFKNISDLVSGFKELYINEKKRNEFKKDMESSCKSFRDTRINGEYKFVHVSIMSEILYIGIIGLVVFTFPILFSDIEGSTLRNFVLVLLYMSGIVNQTVFFIPSFVRVLVSWKRINKFINDLSLIEDKYVGTVEGGTKELLIQFKGVKYHYKNESGESFSLGPIDYEFKAGESVFIMGGNGSGKTTLAKLITGLFEPDEGEIAVNGCRVDSRTLGSLFSTVYSDFHLFNKLYGIDHENKKEDIQKYLKILHIEDKVQINEGVFSTLKLSTGQRKRLALLASFLEDRPAYLFDEWAADQDPEFRKFFYKTLIPQLKSRGKVVISITHDDAYFNYADKLIKMEFGSIVDQNIFV
jgi:putative pyoverdin transport system ATP-binding/permease protein